jgi:hypothetical protein
MRVRRFPRWRCASDVASFSGQAFSFDADGARMPFGMQ